MAYRAHVLVIASVTATSDDLLAALKARADRGPIDITLLLPSSGPGLSGRNAARAHRGARAVRRGAVEVARGGPGGERRRRQLRSHRGRPRGVEPGPLRRGDRLDAARQELALAADGLPPAGGRAHRLPGHSRRGDGHAPRARPRAAAGARALAARPARRAR